MITFPKNAYVHLRQRTMIRPSSAALGFSLFGLDGAVMSRNDLEPWDKTMYDYTEKKTQ